MAYRQHERKVLPARNHAGVRPYIPADQDRSVTEQRTFVLDTSVLLADPRAIRKFDEHHIVLPVVVLHELAAKRHDPVLGWAARSALRSLEQLRQQNPSLLERCPVNDVGGTVRVEMNHQDQGNVHEALRGNSNDHRILTVAVQLQHEDYDVTLVSKDLPLRIDSSLAGVPAEEYHNEQADSTDWTGLVTVETDEPGLIDLLYEAGHVLMSDVDDAVADLPLNTGVVLTAGSQKSAVGRVTAGGMLAHVDANQRVKNLRGRSVEQRFAIDLLNDDTVPLLSIGGPAGTGKTVLTMAAALDALDAGRYQRIMVVRSLYAVGNQSLGYLPGDAEEKMQPWGLAVTDAMEELENKQKARQRLEQGEVEIGPMTYLRGRTLRDTFLIIDEGQQYERSVLLTALSRVGENTKAVITHDVAQRDNLHVGRYDGIMSVVARLQNNVEFGHIELQKTERSRAAELVTSLLDDGA